MGWLAALGILTLLAVLPLGASVSYDADGAVVRLIIGPLKITLFPRQKKEKKPDKKTKKANPKKEKKIVETKQRKSPKQESAQAASPARKKQSEPESSVENFSQPNEPAGTKQNDMAPKLEKKTKAGPISDFLPLVRMALEMLGVFRRRLRVNNLNLKLIMAGDDPCDLAVNYGRVWAAVGNLLPQLEKVFVIKKRNIEVECDFVATEMLVIARLDLTITLGRILATVFVYGIRAVIEFLKINKKRKGGAS